VSRALAVVDRAITSRWGILAAIALYWTGAIAIGVGVPGLQYDEAIFQHGGVHMLRSADAPPFTYNHATWIRIGGRHVPLMVLPYIGSLTFFLHALPFAVFGPTAVTARTVNLLLGALGIWGIGRFGQSRIGPRLGTALAFVLAIHPGYLTWTLYDNTGVAIWMAALGIACLAADRYIERVDSRSAFALGVCLGLAVWCRANFVWLFAGVLLALAVVLRGKLLAAIRHWPMLVAGGVLGSLPLLLYEIASGLGTLQFMQAASGDASRLRLVPARLALGAQALVYDAHRRGIWRGPEVPPWQVFFFALVLVLAVVVCMVAVDRKDPRGTVCRIAALALVFAVGLTLTSPIRLGPWHFFVYFPLAALVALGAVRVVSRWRGARVVVLAIGIGYAAVTLSWDVQTAAGIRETGGVGMWSDAVFAVAEAIETTYAGRTINVLDWGLTNNLYVLTGGGFRPRELYWGSTSERTGHGTTWGEEIAQGGVFLLNGPTNAFRKGAAEGFRRAVEQSGLAYSKMEFRQRDRRVYAELYEIAGGPIPGGRADVRPPAGATRRILRLFPSTVVIGQRFNEQPNGSSALAIRGEGFSQGDRIFWDGRALVTTFGTSELLTALVPRALLRQPGIVNISVRDVSRPELAEVSTDLRIER